MLFNLAIKILQKWLEKNKVEEDAVFIISAYGYSFDDYKKYKNIV